MEFDISRNMVTVVETAVGRSIINVKFVIIPSTGSKASLPFGFGQREVL